MQKANILDVVILISNFIFLFAQNKLTIEIEDTLRIIWQNKDRFV